MRYQKKKEASNLHLSRRNVENAIYLRQQRKTHLIYRERKKASSAMQGEFECLSHQISLPFPWACYTEGTETSRGSGGDGACDRLSRL